MDIVNDIDLTGIRLAALAASALDSYYGDLRRAKRLIADACDAIPAETTLDWLGPASDAFRDRGRRLRNHAVRALDDLNAAMLIVEAELR